MRAALSKVLVNLAKKDSNVILLTGDHGYSLFDLLSELESKFGLNYEINESIDIINATGSKINYYSTNKIPKDMGYDPINTSLESVIQEINFLGL